MLGVSGILKLRTIIQAFAYTYQIIPVPSYPSHRLAARRFHSHAEGRENLCRTTGCQVNAKLAIGSAAEESLDQTDSDPRLCQHCSGNFGKYGGLKITISSQRQEIIQTRPIVIAKFD